MSETSNPTVATPRLLEHTNAVQHPHTRGDGGVRDEKSRYLDFGRSRAKRLCCSGILRCSQLSQQWPSIAMTSSGERPSAEIEGSRLPRHQCSRAASSQCE